MPKFAVAIDIERPRGWLPSEGMVIDMTVEADNEEKARSLALTRAKLYTRVESQHVVVKASAPLIPGMLGMFPTTEERVDDLEKRVDKIMAVIGHLAGLMKVLDGIV